MGDEKIDIHRTERNYALAMSRLETDESIISKNKDLILRHLDDCALEIVASVLGLHR